MALATAKYHVTLNAAGYTLHPQSYKLKAQPPFTPRFATGDPSLGDLSFWQFFSQEDFSGGEGQDFFNNKTKFRKSFALDMRDGKPRQPFPATQLTLDTAIPNLGTAGWQHKFKFVPFGGDLVLVGPSASDKDLRSDRNRRLPLRVLRSRCYAPKFLWFSHFASPVVGCGGRDARASAAR